MTVIQSACPSVSIGRVCRITILVIRRFQRLKGYRIVHLNIMGVVMPSAYVLVSTELGRENEVRDNLRAFYAVRKAYGVYGVYDIILEVEAEDEETLKKTVFNQIRRMDGVRSTL